MEERRYPHVHVDVADEEAEEAGAQLFALGAVGVEQRDATTLIGGAPGRTTLVAAFDSVQHARSAIGDLPAAWARTARLEEVIGDAWRDEWKKHFEPFSIAPGVVVRPPWREYEPLRDERVIVLEPGRAFGTGLHETTSLIAEVIAEQASHFRGQPVLDVGAGSGILALVSLALGASHARCLDIDPDAVVVARENAARNGLSSRLVADTTSVDAIHQRYAAVLANIDAPTLIDLSSAIRARVAPAGLLVLSGVLASDVSPGQLDGVLRAYVRHEAFEVRRKGEWVAVSLRNP